jgi:hypothetical protein
MIRLRIVDCGLWIESVQGKVHRAWNKGLSAED